MHNYADNWPHFAAVAEAAHYIGQGLRRWGRVDVVQTKEKFGTARVYCYFGLVTFHQLAHPGYMHYRWPSWAWRLDRSWLARAIRALLNVVLIPYQEWLYRLYYRKARDRWPHLAQEIYRGADWPGLLGAKIKARPGGGGIIWWPEWDEEPPVEVR